VSEFLRWQGRLWFVFLGLGQCLGTRADDSIALRVEFVFVRLGLQAFLDNVHHVLLTILDALNSALVLGCRQRLCLGFEDNLEIQPCLL